LHFNWGSDQHAPEFPLLLVTAAPFNLLCSFLDQITRVKRTRPDSLDAYDLPLRAIPNVYVAMPDEVGKALPLLAFQPDYALVHGLLAWCHEVLFVSLK